MRSRSLSPAGTHQNQGIRTAEHSLGPVKEDDVWREDGAEMGPEGVQRVLEGDVGYVMRRRAEEGYGLGNVSCIVVDTAYRA